ncbi:MAG TPA: hypothetical protein VH062_32000 [Polyangiaceae bacterium]|nr:hypothetical protein [Polyangiaceae bacterium]
MTFSPEMQKPACVARKRGSRSFVVIRFSIEVERLLDAGIVVVMQGHYVAKGKATGKSVRA